MSWDMRIPYWHLEEGAEVARMRRGLGDASDGQRHRPRADRGSAVGDDARIIGLRTRELVHHDGRGKAVGGEAGAARGAQHAFVGNGRGAAQRAVGDGGGSAIGGQAFRVRRRRRPRSIWRTAVTRWPTSRWWSKARRPRRCSAYAIRLWWG